MSIYPPNVIVKPLQTDKIKFFQQRGPGEKITATFDFLRENRSAWLKSCAWPVIPVALIYGWMKTNAITFSLTYDPELFHFDLMNLTMGFTLKNCPLVSVPSLLILVALWILFTATSAMIHLYEYRTERLQGVTWEEWREALLHALGYSTVAALMAFLLLYALSLAGSLLVLLLVAAAFPLALFAPACSLGRCGGAFASFSRALSLGITTWGGIAVTLAGLWLVLFFLREASDVVNVILHRVIIDLVNTDGFSPVLSKCVLTLSYAAVYWVSLLCFSAMMCCAAYLYGHAEEKISFISLDDDIRNFEHL